MADVHRLLEAEKLQRTLRAHDAVVRTCCALCAAGCGMRFAVRGERVIDVWGDDEHPLSKGSLCALGSAAVQLPGSAARVLRPRLRERAGQAHREVSWDEALDHAAARLGAAALRREGIGILQASAVDFASAMSARRFASVAGCHLIPQRDAAEDTVFESYLESPSAREWPCARTLLLVGADPAEREVVTMGWVIDARLRGANVVALDTRPTVAALKASSVLPVGPGNAAAVLTALAGAVIESGHADRECMQARIEDVDAWVEHCRRATLEDAATLAGLAVERLRTLAESLAQAYPMLIVLDPEWLGPHFAATTRAAYGLVCTLGSIGVPSGGLACLGGIDVTRRKGAAPTVPARPEAAHGALIVELDAPSTRAEIDASLRHAHPPTFVVALAALESRLAQRADLVLPIALWLESEGVLHRNTSRVLQWHRKIVPPPGEARTAAWVWASLAARLGFAGEFPWLSGDGAIDHGTMLDALLGDIPETAGIPCAALLEERAPGGVTWPPAKAGCDDAEQPTFACWGRQPMRRVRIVQGAAGGAHGERASSMATAEIELPSGAWPWIERLGA